jgi:hypothetical protein
LTTRKTSASSPSSESIPWSRPTCRSSPMYSLLPSGLWPQAISIVSLLVATPGLLIRNLRRPASH